MNLCQPMQAIGPFAEAESRRKTVIVVDDVMINLAIAKNILMDSHDVVTVPSGACLFQTLKKVTPDLILLDIEMPEMDGYEVIRRLKGAEQTTAIPVIFVTSLDDAESEARGFALGAVDYIIKPYAAPELMQSVDRHLEAQAQWRETEIARTKKALPVAALHSMA